MDGAEDHGGHRGDRGRGADEQAAALPRYPAEAAGFAGTVIMRPIAEGVQDALGGRARAPGVGAPMFSRTCSVSPWSLSPRPLRLPPRGLR